MVLTRKVIGCIRCIASFAVSQPVGLVGGKFLYAVGCACMPTFCHVMLALTLDILETVQPTR